MYKRLLKKTISNKFFKGKVIIITGSRQTGKTTLSLDLISDFILNNSTQIFNCDNPTDREMLYNKDKEFLKHLIGNKKIIFIDEAQKVPNIGNTLKLLVDEYKEKKQILATGSSSVNLLNNVQEELTGRKYVYTLYPLSMQEIYDNYQELYKNLENFLIYGAYPEVVTTQCFEDKKDLLRELTESSLFKDIFEFQQIRNPEVLRNLLRSLALQIGSEVSYTELSNLLGIDKNTVRKYVELLEKNFIIFRLRPYIGNKRREISKLRKIYFYDLGIRNTLINNLNFIEKRNDLGGLWENFIMIERMKYRTYNSLFANQYFWRTYDGVEVDLIEEREGMLHGYEFKWNLTGMKTKIRIPKKWKEYSNTSYTQISRNNLTGFII